MSSSGAMKSLCNPFSAGSIFIKMWQNVCLLAADRGGDLSVSLDCAFSSREDTVHKADADQNPRPSSPKLFELEDSSK